MNQSDDEFQNIQNNEFRDNFVNILRDINYRQQNSIFSKNLSDYDNSGSYQNYQDNEKPQIKEILKCYICLNVVKNAQMCPNCSKLCCNNCITKWLNEEKSICPHCRTPMRSHQLINCRFVNEITSNLDKFEVEQNIYEEYCKNHQQNPLQYFCLTCEKSICADCAMLGKDHKGHEFESLDQVYKTHLELILKEQQDLQQMSKEIKNQIFVMDTHIDNVSKQKEDKVYEIKQYCDQMYVNLDYIWKQNLQLINQQKANLQEQSQQIEKMEQYIDNEVNEKPQSQLIQNSMSLIKQIKETCQVQIKPFVIENINFELNSQLQPDFSKGVLVLKNFRDIKDETVYSEQLNMNGIIWRIKVYPKGNGVAKDQYLSVFLEMVQGVQEGNKYEYKIQMVNLQDPVNSLIREFTSEFNTEECWGYNRFYKLENLVNDGFLNDHNKIILKYFVRPTSYYQQSQDQIIYIKQLEEKNFQSMIKQGDSNKLKNNSNEFEYKSLNDIENESKESFQIDLMASNEIEQEKYSKYNDDQFQPESSDQKSIKSDYLFQ